MNGVILSAVVALLVSAWILIGLDGWHYYSTPIRVRGYHPLHALLRPSGAIGRVLGIVGAILMLVPFGYMLLKRSRRLRGIGSLKTWLEIHIFCGIVGPVLVTYHTAFKFNGLVSVAYWSMMIVAFSGFVGRYLYVRIPRTIRGVEVSEGELSERAGDLKESLAWLIPPSLMDRFEQFERESERHGVARPTVTGYFFGGWQLQRRLTKLRSELLTADDGATKALSEAIDLVTERAYLTRRLAYLRTTKKLFDLWHVFHLPLVYVMFVIVTAHVAVAVYMGYGPHLW